MSDLHEISMADLVERRATVEQMLADSSDIDRWCSSPEWVFAVQQAFAPHVEPVVLWSWQGVALLCRTETPDGRSAIPGLEPMWGFASPIVSPDPEGFAADFATWLRHDPRWEAIVLPGLPRQGALVANLVDALHPLAELRGFAGIDRVVADLDGDADTWLSRRSRRFRRDLANDRARAADLGVEIVVADDDPDVYDRILAIEHRSWKADEASGLTAPDMETLYRLLSEALGERDALRVRIARRSDEDLAYVMGGLRGDIYRGLQLSFVRGHESLRLGHLLQSHEIERLASTGVRAYDLGMDLEYKRRWGDRVVPSLVLVGERTSTPATSSGS